MTDRRFKVLVLKGIVAIIYQLCNPSTNIYAREVVEEAEKFMKEVGHGE